MRHTLGPWEISQFDDTPKDHVSISGDGWVRFADVVVRLDGEPFDHPQGVANATLIAAAPDMAEVSRDALPILDAVLEEREEINGEEDEVLRDLIARFRAALIKAGIEL